ncbi:hypothetical protein ONS95_009630 [Cadophora gregata]|uniref:uncharacterized protein n=1 Tax=Cadophora gregata TaxID=51156 RepID=UPI0026DD1651|nr:uncharacterized protein ONS95_009630 [Cadophora gregata]KAK0124685.1 hypothetical protein ONS95_009630 [Cadophora gregata]KAK0129455.1 hypothetical protein ONS96_000027 [Cadophora gregata f. sp. sojae]
MGNKKQPPLQPAMDDPAPPSYSNEHLTGAGSDSIEPLPPTYTQNDISTPSPRYSQNNSHRNGAPITAESLFFAAINEGNHELVARYLSEGLVTASTRYHDETPLLRAVKARNVEIVKQLLEAGAEIDEFGVVSTQYDPTTSSNTTTLRNPLQLASSLGHLILVKLLIETYHASDSLVAPDGQIALRLAAENNHLEIVEYLPSRRTGGFKRWQFKNRKSLNRIKQICKRIAGFIKFFLWDVEKFFLWTVPKHVLVKPIVKGCKWCWERRGRLGPWCKHQMLEMPGRVKRAGICAGRQAVKVPRGMVKVAKGAWKFGMETLPRLIKDCSKWLWKLLTVKLPKALQILGDWIVSGITSLGRTIWNAVLKVISFFSTVIEAIVSFFKSLTLQDIWNGFVEILRAIFVTFPKLIVSWVKEFGDMSYKMMKALFGTLGKVLWVLGYAILWVITFLPKQLWRILESIGASLAKAGYEVKVWVNPKAR